MVRFLGLVLEVGGEKIFEKTGNGGGANSADFGGDGGKVVAVIEGWIEVAAQHAFFASGASVDENGARGDEAGGDETGNTSGGDDEVKIFESS